MEESGAGRSRESSWCSNGDEDNKIVDGSELIKLVENKEVFSSFVDDKFEELDRDHDGKLSVKELRPAVADIGAALGLPPQGSSPDSDQIYSQVLKEFTHGKEEKVSKSEFKEVLSDILVGMAAGLKRDPIVILRIDGEDLLEFIHGPTFQSIMLPIYSDIIIHNPPSPDDHHPSPIRQYIIRAFQKLTVEQGMPPCSDPWVMSNIVEPAVVECCVEEEKKAALLGLDDAERFLEELKKVGERVAQLLKEQPVIVAHTDNTFDGSAIRRLLTNKFELDKTINAALQNIPRDKHGKISKEHLRVVLDSLAPAAGLPPLGAVDQTDMMIEEALKMVEADDGKAVKEEELKKMVMEILGSVMLQLEANPISVSYSSVVHEPLSSASSLLQVQPPLSTPPPHPTN